MPASQPSNKEILGAIESLHETVRSHDRDIAILLTWKAGVEAVDRYIARKSSSERDDGNGVTVDWTKIILAILGVTTALIAIIATLLKLI